MLHSVLAGDAVFLKRNYNIFIQIGKKRGEKQLECQKAHLAFSLLLFYLFIGIFQKAHSAFSLLLFPLKLILQQGSMKNECEQGKLNIFEAPYAVKNLGEI